MKKHILFAIIVLIAPLFLGCAQDTPGSQMVDYLFVTSPTPDDTVRDESDLTNEEKEIVIEDLADHFNLHNTNSIPAETLAEKPKEVLSGEIGSIGFDNEANVVVWSEDEADGTNTVEYQVENTTADKPLINPDDIPQHKLIPKYQLVPINIP